MSQDSKDGLAAEYVLGTLDPRERQSFAEALEEDPALQRLVADWEQRLGAFDHEVAPVSPPAGLWDKIEASVGVATGAGAVVTVREAEGGWQTISEGVDKKVLASNPSDSIETYLLRLAPGSRLPGHGHESAEDCLVLKGELTIGDLRLGAGDYHMAPPGMWHGEIVSEKGALLYIRGEMR